jgi:hypothetical protein
VQPILWRAEEWHCFHRIGSGKVPSHFPYFLLRLYSFFLSHTTTLLLWRIIFLSHRVQYHHSVLKVCSSEYSQTHTLRRLNTFGQHCTWWSKGDGWTKATIPKRYGKFSLAFPPFTVFSLNYATNPIGRIFPQTGLLLKNWWSVRLSNLAWGPFPPLGVPASFRESWCP